MRKPRTEADGATPLTDGPARAKPPKNRREEFKKLSALDIKLCPDYGILYYSPSEDKYWLEGSDSDSEADIQAALKKLRGVVGENRIDCEAEYVPESYRAGGYVCDFGSKEWSGAGDEEVLAPLPSQLQILPIASIKLHPSLPIHDHSDDAADKEEEETETFDVDKKMFKVWECGTADSPAGTYFLIDGHHHLQKANAATHFVSSKIQEGRLVSAKPEVNCRVFRECEGWTLPLVQKLSYAMNFEAKKALVADLQPFGPDHPIADTFATDSKGSLHIGFVDFIAGDSVQIISRDSKKGVLMTVRQAATRCDWRNANGRNYPRAVLNAAVADANKRAAAGVMLSELLHPNYGKDCSRGLCTDKFFDNHDRKSAIVKFWEPCDRNGWVFVTRDITDTPAGKIVADAIEKKEPIGLSTRFFFSGAMRKAEDGSWANYADHMTISTIDDVDDPAVTGAGSFHPVADSALRELAAHDSQTDLGPPFNGENTIEPPAPVPNDEDHGTRGNDRRSPEAARSYKPMKLDISRLIGDFAAKYAKPGNGQISYLQDGKTIVSALADEKKAGHCIKESLGLFFKAVVDSTMIGGYTGGSIETIVAAELGGKPGDGWGSEIENGSGLTMLKEASFPDKPEAHGTGAMKNAGQAAKRDKKDDDDDEDAEEMARRKKREEGMDSILAAAARKERKKAVKVAFRTAADSHAEFKKLDTGLQLKLEEIVRTQARDEKADFVALLDAQLDLIHAAHTQARRDAAGGAAQGKTVNDAGSPTAHLDRQPGQGNRALASNVMEAFPWWADTKAFLDAADDVSRKNKGRDGFYDPDNPEVKALRDFNMNTWLKPVLDDFAQRWAKEKTFDGFAASMDSTSGPLEDRWFKNFTDAQRRSLGDNASIVGFDATTTQQIFGQPWVLTTLIIQAFWNLTMAQFCGTMGPREFDETSGGFQKGGRGFGQQLRLPTLSYNPGSGWAYRDGRFSAGLKTPEGQGIAPGNTNVSWLSYSVIWRKIASIMTWEAVKSIGNGPANMPLASLELLMMASEESRVIDIAMGNAILQAGYEFQALAVAGEVYSTNNNLLVNNSAYVAAGPVKVNLNPAKTANTAFASTDMNVTYPAAPASGAQVVGAIRLACGCPNNNASPYYGIKNINGVVNTIGPGAVVRPRTENQIPYNGQPTPVTYNQATVVVGGQTLVLGEITAAGGIWSYPGTNAQAAFDWENGLLCLAANSGITGSAGLITTNVTASYSASTNWDDFIGDKTIAAGLGYIGNSGTVAPNYETYLSGFLSQIDRTAALMGSGGTSTSGNGNYVKPDFVLGTLVGSPYIADASIFYQWASPNKTELLTNPTSLGHRTGVEIHRHNTPWNGMNRTFVVGRKGATRAAWDTPFFIQGPTTVQDANGNPTGELGFYGQSAVVIETPQPIDQNGNVLQCPFRNIINRTLTEQVGVF